MASFQSNFNINKSYMSCPYNPTHRVPTNRMPIHLIKCEKTSNICLMVCPFNALHRYPRDKIEEHIANCKYRTYVVNSSITLPDGLQPNHTKNDRFKGPDRDDIPPKEESKKDEEYWD